MDNIREEFEQWFYDNAGLKCKFDSYDNAYVTASSKTTGDTIVNTSCCIAWQSWKSSRSALCVELPDSWMEHNDAVCGLGELTEQLDKAGVTYK